MEEGQIGRVAELDLLTDAVHTTVAGTGGVVLIEGEAGIGKTRLVDDAIATAERLGCVVASGTQDPIGVNRPFGVLTDALADLSGEPLATAGTSELSIHDALVDAVERAATQAPVVLAVENLHWADGHSLEVLSRLVRTARQTGLLLVLTTRPFGTIDRLHGLVGVVTAAGGTHLSLQPLGEDEVVDLAAQRLGIAPGPTLVDRLGAAGGNPLFVLELIRGLDDHGAMIEADGAIDLRSETVAPPVNLTILRQLSVLSPGALRIVRSASILGRSFTLQDVRLVSTDDVGDVTDGIEEALGAGILATAGVELRFRHDLVWELLYGDVAEPVRAAMHLDAARALIAAGREATDVVDHLLLGLTQLDRDDFGLVITVIDTLRGRAPTLVLDVAERALATSPTDDDQLITLHAERALALLATGDTDRGREACRSLLASGVGPPIRGQVREALLASLTMAGQLDEAITLCEAALASSVIDDVERSHLTASLAFAKLHAGQIDDSIDLAAVAASAAPPPETAVAARAHTIKAHALSHLGRFSECVDVALAAIADLDERGGGALHFAHSIAGSRMMMLDRFDEAQDVLERGRLLYERHGSAAALCQYHVSKGFGHFIHGDWDDAVAEFMATENLGEEGLAWPVLSHGTLALIAANRDDVSAARDHLTVVDDALANGAAPLRLDLSLRAKATLAETSPVIDDDADELAHRQWEALTAGSALISALGFTPQIAQRLAQADDDGAHLVVDALQTCATYNPDAPSIVGAAALSEGIVTGNVDAMRSCLDTYDRSENVLARSFALRTVADTLISDGEVGHAADLLGAARQVCEPLGATAELRLIDRACRAAGIPVPTASAKRPVSGWESLTPTETIVVSYLARRLSNPEIADAMFISRRTVESHVSSILAKLGVRSRVEVAKWAEAGARSAP